MAKENKYRIISDTHFGHDMLVSSGFRKEGYEEKIIKNLNRLTENDILIHLGDVCIGNDYTWHENVIKNLKCKKFLTKGNHDRKSSSWYLDNGWDFVCESFTMTQYGMQLRFSHEPFEGPNYGLQIHGHYHDRFDRNLGKDKGRWYYACEYENYAPKTLESIIKSFNS